VVVATPPDAHADLTVRALETGAHVLCEKPLAGSVAEADRMLAAAAAAGRTVAVNHHFRRQPIFAAVKQEIGSTRAGELVFCQVAQLLDLSPWEEPARWRADMAAASLLEGGVHLVDLILHLFGRRPEAVWASLSGGPGAEGDALSLVSLEFGAGRLAQLTINRVTKTATRFAELRADCERASLRASDGGRAQLEVGKVRARRGGVRLNLAPGGSAWLEQGTTRRRLARNPRSASVHAVAALLGETVQAFETGADPPCPGTEARDAVATVEAAYRSASTGARVGL
jgi:predicted dehydrogenase